MKCRDVLHQMALHLGKDSCERDALHEVRRHLSACLECRRRYHQLKDALAAVEQAAAPDSFDVTDSLWPALQTRLDEPRVSRAATWSVRTWAPVATVAVACLLLVVTINTTLPQAERPFSDPAVHPRNASSLSPFLLESPPRWNRETREDRKNPLPVEKPEEIPPRKNTL